MFATEAVVLIVLVVWLLPIVWVAMYCDLKHMPMNYVWCPILFGLPGIGIVILAHMALLMEIRLREVDGIEASAHLWKRTDRRDRSSRTH